MVRCAVCCHVFEIRNHWELRVIVCSDCRERNPDVVFCGELDETGERYDPVRMNERVEK